MPKFAQPTLFGKRAKKGPFFGPDCPNTDYYQVIEALWKTSGDSVTDRKQFLEVAQREWTLLYKDDANARISLMARAGRVADADTKLSESFLRDRDGPPSESSACASPSVSVTVSEPESSNPYRHTPTEKLLARLKVDKSSFLTEDVTVKVSLMSLLDEVSQLWMQFESERSCYERLITNRRRKSSKLSVGMSAIDHKLEDLRKLLLDISSISVPKSSLLTASGMRSLNNKLEKVTHLSSVLPGLKTAIRPVLRRVQVRNAQMMQRGVSRKTKDIVFYCENCPEFSWDAAIEELKTAVEDRTFIDEPLSASQLLGCAEMMAFTNALPLASLLAPIMEENDTDSSDDSSDDENMESQSTAPPGADLQYKRFKHRAIVQLARYLPVVVVFQRSTRRTVVVNMAAFSLLASGDTFVDLLLLCEPSQSPGASARREEPDSVYHHLPRAQPGRKTIHSQFPEIVTVVTDFIQSHGFSAQSRRRNSTGNSMGVSLADIQAHILTKVPSLKSISRTTVHELMVAPRKRTRNAQRYHGLVKSRVPGKDNSVRKTHPDAHYAFAQVRYIKEFCQEFKDECAQLSCDDMNKVNVGVLAVSRYHQIGRFFPEDDAPRYPDHDFPFRNSKLIPSGYMILEDQGSASPSTSRIRSRSMSRQPVARHGTRSASWSPSATSSQSNKDFKLDKHGRLHYVVPHTGPLHVVARASRFHSATSTAHASDLTNIFCQVPAAQRKIISLLVDGGPDFSPKHVVNLLTYGRLWKDRCLDALIITCHAPGQSAHNDIEHAWSPLSKALAGVTLPNHLEGQLPPEQQRLSKEDTARQEAVVFDQAIDILTGYWDKLTFDSHAVIPSGVPCTDCEERYRDHEDLATFVKSSRRVIERDAAMLETRSLLSFLCRHVSRSTYQTTFLKCDDDSCEHCVAHPVEAVKAVALLRSLGGHMFTPTPSAHLDGHYSTYLECRTYYSLGKAQLLLDAGLPSGEPDRCPFGCSYAFMSVRDADRHVCLVHPANWKQYRKASNAAEKSTVSSAASASATAASTTVTPAAEPPAAKRACHRCKFEGCDMAFTSNYQLQQHKKAEGHQLKRGRPSKK